MYPMRLPRLPRIYPITPSSPMADFVDQWSANGLKNIFGTQRQGRGDAVRGRRGRRGARLPGRRRSDHHLHRVPGPAADDPQHVQDRRLSSCPAVFHVSARTVSTHALNIFGDHSDVYGLPPDRLCHAVRGQRAGGHGPRPRRASGRAGGQGSLHQLLRRLPYQPRDPEDRGLGLRGPEGNVRHGRRQGRSASTP